MKKNNNKEAEEENESLGLSIKKQYFSNNGLEIRKLDYKQRSANYLSFGKDHLAAYFESSTEIHSAKIIFFIASFLFKFGFESSK